MNNAWLTLAHTRFQNATDDMIAYHQEMESLGVYPPYNELDYERLLARYQGCRSDFFFFLNVVHESGLRLGIKDDGGYIQGINFDGRKERLEELKS